MKASQTENDFSVLADTVIDNGLCTRCGICSGACPVNVISLDENYFPKLTGECVKCGLCVECCPGGDVNFPKLSMRIFKSEYNHNDLLGFIDNIFIGRSASKEMRMAGASGGLVTGLLTYLLEKKRIDGAVVVAMDQEKGYLTKGILATTVQNVKDAAQSKYCITPSMEVLKEIRKRNGRFGVVALPCQLHGLRKLEEADPSLSKKICYYLGLFCNCNLNPNGHIEAISACNIDLTDVEKFNFRGAGWPGGFYVQKKDGTEESLHKINIKNVMNVMFRIYSPERCSLCYDAVAEYADLSFGDFWAFDYLNDYSGYEQHTLVYQRTDRGRALLEQAMADGAIYMHRVPYERNSKRILNMAKGKKSRALARIYRRKMKKLAIPQYHFPVQKPSKKARRSLLFYNIFLIFRGPLRRKLLLKVLFSPVGEILDRLNIMRKNMFCNYNDN